MPLLYVCCAWLLGTLTAAHFSFPWLLILVSLLPLPAAIVMRRYRKTLVLTSLCLAAFFTAGLRFASSRPIFDQTSLQFYNNTASVRITGAVIGDPDIRDTSQLIRLAASEITTENTAHIVSGVALVRLPRYSDIGYGDLLKVTGRLNTPPTLDGFDYKGYLAQQGIYSTMDYPRVELVRRSEGSVLAAIFSFRHRISEVLQQTISEPQGALGRGIVLGIRSDIPPDLSQAFVRTGTAHLLAISGMNLSVVIGLVMALCLRIFGRRYSIYIWATMALLWSYTIFTGAMPPVVRGAIMGSMFLLAEFFGRQRSAGIPLTLAAATMIAIEPQLLWNVSFQLSFLAMAGLVVLAPAMTEWLMTSFTSLSPDGAAAATVTTAGTAAPVAYALAVSVSAIIMTFPATAYYFGIVSAVGLPATLLSLLLQPAIIVLTVLTGVLGLVFLPLAYPLAWIAWLILSLFIVVVRAFDALPFSSFQFADMPVWQVLAYYTTVSTIVLISVSRRRLRVILSPLPHLAQQTWKGSVGIVSRLPKRWLVPALACLFTLVWLSALTLPDEHLHVTFLNVGQGDAILVQTPQRQTILIDGGPSPQAIMLELGRKMRFWERQIDLVVLTQPQADHMTGLIEVLRRYRARKILEPAMASTSGTYEEWREAASESGAYRATATAGQSIDLGGGVKLEVLNPPSPDSNDFNEDFNNGGTVLRLVWKKVSFLFTADIQEAAEFDLIARRTMLESTVLKVAHHGSRTSTSDRFLSAVSPALAVISAGRDNRFGHPHPEVIDRLETKLSKSSIYLTSVSGAVEFVTDGDRLWLKK